MSGNNNDFLAKATAATQRVAASATVQQNATPEQAKIVQELAQDRPTIHAAVTSFLSLVAARSLVAPDIDKQQQQQQQQQGDPPTFTNAEALKCSRILLKAINTTTLSAMPTSTSSEEYSLVAQLWNGLIASEQKPARFLGRRAMKQAWSDVKPAVTTTQEDDKILSFVEEFERLLFWQDQPNQDNDAALIWDSDGGKAELQRRRERREQRAKEASQQPEEAHEEDQKLPFIEELPEEKE